MADVSADTLKQQVRKQLGGFVEGGRLNERICIADNRYVLLDGEVVGVDWLIQSIQTDPIISPAKHSDVYHEDLFDCDDYVFYLRNKVALFIRGVSLHPLAFGCILTKLHAFNFCYEQPGLIRLINTQNTPDVTTTSDQGEFERFLGIQHGNRVVLVYV